MSDYDYKKLGDFMKGVEDGKRGEYNTGRDYVLEQISLGFLGGPTVDEEAYDEGYVRGRKIASSGK